MMSMTNAPLPSDPGQQSRVITMAPRGSSGVFKDPDRRRSGVGISALICVGLPTLIAAVYFFLIAANQFAVEARFAVRGNQSPAEQVGIFASLGASPRVSDSYIVIDFIRSREMVSELTEHASFISVYSKPQADRFVRLDPSSPMEERVKYWERRVSAYFDSTKQTVNIEVRAFTQEDALSIARSVVDASERLVNRLSEKARRDSVRFAEVELARAEYRLKVARREVTTFRNQSSALDPGRSAEAIGGIITSLEGERAKVAAELASVMGRLGANAPSVTAMRARISAIEAEIRQYRSQLSGSASPVAGTVKAAGAPLSNLIESYQELEVERELSEKLYAAAMANLERARADADRQQLYLATFVEPKLPDDALYPKRILNTFLVALSAAALWIVGVLFYFGIRDHAQ
jgi:capsular polysaccharide transport system permease protein